MPSAEDTTGWELNSTDVPSGDSVFRSLRQRTKPSMASYSARPSRSYNRAVSAFRSCARFQNSRLSGPGNKARSFCDSCLKIATRFRSTSSGLSGTAISISCGVHSCQAPRYNHTSHDSNHSSSLHRSHARKIAVKQVRCVPCGSDRSPAA